MAHLRLTSRCLPGMAAAALLAFVMDVHILVRDNGSGKMALVYTATPISTPDTERFRFDSSSTRAQHVQIRDGLARVRLLFDDVTKISQANELSQVPVEFGPAADGTRRVWARLRSPIVVQMKEDGPANIRLTVPGRIVKSTGEETSERTASWSVPVSRYFSTDGIEIEAIYRLKD